MSPLPISLCMIVKDEADWIRQCLESVRPIVQQMIVVDTGSSDETKAIAQELGAEVYDFAWCDDFATARNFSLQQAKQPWILVLDGDEQIASEDLLGFKALISDSRICTEFLQRHYCDDPRVSNFVPVRGEFPRMENLNVGYFESNCCRLFPNDLGLEFRGRIHELVEHSIHELKKHKIVRSQIRIHHYGHTQKVKDKKNKSILYGTLGAEKISDAPQDWKAYYELGVEYNCAGNLHQSVQMLVKSIELRADYLDTWVNLGYVFCELAMYSEAEKTLLHALKLAPRSSEALCNLGVVYLRQARLPQAEAYFKNAVRLNPKYLNALCNLGKSLANQGRLAEAASTYLDALYVSPACGAALIDMATLYEYAGQRSEAQFFLEKAKALPLSDERTRQQVADLTAKIKPGIF